MSSSPAVRSGRLIAVLAAAGILGALTQTLVAPLIAELPTMFDTTASNASWVVTVTLLTGAVFTPIAGRLADARARRADGGSGRRSWPYTSTTTAFVAIEVFDPNRLSSGHGDRLVANRCVVVGGGLVVAAKQVGVEVSSAGSEALLEVGKTCLHPPEVALVRPAAHLGAEQLRPARSHRAGERLPAAR